MLLMVPFNVIDSVPAISEYLETGKSDSSRKKLQEALEENIARSKSIVDASVDAIIITNAQGTINVFNPASERLLKYESTEIIGQSILNIIPLNAHENNPELQAYLSQLNSGQTPIKAREMIAVDKFGAQFPVHMSLSEGTISGKSFCAIFIRDITDIKASEKALLQEKERTDKLLVSLLPKYVSNLTRKLIFFRSVAKILKEEEHKDSKERALIAEAYKEVTVLFADIVGFTTWASKASPTELIFTLNELFSQWDSLCEKWHLEKIKTIGDW